MPRTKMLHTTDEYNSIKLLSTYFLGPFAVHLEGVADRALDLRESLALDPLLERLLERDFLPLLAGDLLLDRLLSALFAGDLLLDLLLLRFLTGDLLLDLLRLLFLAGDLLLDGLLLLFLGGDLLLERLLDRLLDLSSFSLRFAGDLERLLDRLPDLR